MFKKLRRRFVVLIMIITGLIVMGIFIAVFSVNTINLKNSYNRALQALAEQDITTDEDKEFTLPSDLKYLSGVVKIEAVYINDKLQAEIVAKQKGTTCSTEELYEITNEIIMTKKTNGVLRDHEIRFFVMKDEFNRYVITYCKTVHETRFVVKMHGVSITCCILCLIGIFAVSEYMSYKFIQPAETAWEQQSRFIADASHELKTPLTVILANNNIMLNHVENKEDEKWLLSTKEEAETMKRMLEDMLYLAKSDARMLKSDDKTLDLSEILFACSLTFDSVAFEKGIIINTDIEKNIEVKGDENELRAVIGILIDNAVKFSHNNKNIDITLKAVKNKAVFTVTDFGEVIPDSELKKIFDRFYQTDKVRTKQGGGAGLGLAIAKSSVERMKGEIKCQSSEGNGTTFTVTLPMFIQNA